MHLWGTEEVAAWLEHLSLCEYKDIFTRHDIRGSELLHLERRDLKVLPHPGFPAAPSRSPPSDLAVFQHQDPLPGSQSFMHRSGWRVAGGSDVSVGVRGQAEPEQTHWESLALLSPVGQCTGSPKSALW